MHGRKLPHLGRWSVDVAKALAVNKFENTRFPLLRGIPTRSPRETGLGFDDAYQLASDIRGKIAETAEITSNGLREKASSPR